jgi:hypothetical protein
VNGNTVGFSAGAVFGMDIPISTLLDKNGVAHQLVKSTGTAIRTVPGDSNSPYESSVTVEIVTFFKPPVVENSYYYVDITIGDGIDAANGHILRFNLEHEVNDTPIV